MAEQSHDSSFDSKLRWLLDKIKKAAKIWVFIGVILTGVFYAQKIEKVKKETPEFAQEILWNWYVPPSND